MLKIEGLSVSHGAQKLLGPASFEVAAGTALVIMGETGAGKSLIAQAVMGALPPALASQGKIWLQGKRVDHLKRKEREQLWGHSLAMLPQEPWRALDPLMPAFNQVYESHRLVAAKPAAQAKQETRSDFQKLRLEGAERKRPGQLSGGMGQRVAFAAALAGGAPVLLADEPTKGLDAGRTETVIQLLKAIPNDGGALVVITHDFAVAQRIGGNLMVLKEGVVVESGNTDEILDAPRHSYTQALITATPSHWKKSTASAVTNEQPLISTVKLIAGHQGAAITRPLDLSITAGKHIAITGPSGVGKSTLLDTLAGLIPPISGTLHKAASVQKTAIQKVYQDPPAAFAPHVSLRKSLSDVARLHQVPWSVIEELLSRLSVGTELLERRPHAVSGGELQRIAITRALAIQPKLLLADEPTSRLDPVTQQQTIQLLAEITRENNTAVLLVTHDAVMAEKWAEETVALGDTGF